MTGTTEALSPRQFTDRAILLTAIRNLSETGEDKFARCRKELDKVPQLTEVIDRVLRPEILLSRQLSVPIRSFASTPLDLNSQLFEEIITTIQELSSRCDSVNDSTPIKRINEIYHTYIQSICHTSGQERLKLMMGPAVVHWGAAPPLGITQDLARKIASLSRFGETNKSNPRGISAVVKHHNVYYKRACINPLAPGDDFIFTSFLSLLANTGSTPTLILKIENVWTKSCDSRVARDDPRRQWLIQHQIQLGSSENVFAQYPAEEETYPFKETHEEHIVQASKSAEGSPICELVNTGAPPELNATSFTLQIILALLLRPQDAHSENYVVTPDKMIINIDPDPIFSELAVKTSDGHFVQMRSILFLLPQMDSEIDSEAVKIFLSKTTCPELFLHELVLNIHKKNEEYLQLLEQGVLSHLDMESLSLPINISLTDVMLVVKQIHKLRQLFIDGSSLTHWSLFSLLYPTLSQFYQCIAKQVTPLEGEKLIFGKQTQKKMEDLMGMSINPDILAIPKSTRSSIPMLAKLWGEQAQMSMMTRDQQTIFLDRMYQLSRSTDLHLIGCGLVDADMEGLVKRWNIQTMTLAECASITARGIIDLLSKCRLSKLTIGKMPNLSADDYHAIFKFCITLDIPVYIQVETQEILIRQDLLPECFTALLLVDDFVRIESLRMLGYTPSPSTQQKNLLYRAAQQGSPKSIDFLLSHGFSIEEKNNRGETPLHGASKEGMLKNVEALINHGANIAATTMDRVTPLHAAANAGKADVVITLLEKGCNGSAVTSSGSTILHIAAFFGYRDLLKCLLERQEIIQLLEVGDIDGKTPLHSSMWGDPKPEIVDRLIKAGAKVNALSLYKYTPLHWAASHGHFESAQLLLDSGSDPLACNDNGDSPIDLASRGDHDQVLRLLWEKIGFVQSPPFHQPAVSPEITYEKCLTGENMVENLFGLAQLGQMFIEGKNYNYAAYVFSRALDIANLFQMDRRFIALLQRKIGKVEGCLLEKLGKKTPAAYQFPTESYRQELRSARIRAESSLGLSIPVATVQAELSTALIALTRRLIKDAFDILQEVPPCAYAVVSFDLLCRQEVAPYSELQFAILIENGDENTLKFFDRLAQLLQLKFIALGESPCPLTFATHDKTASAEMKLGFNEGCYSDVKRIVDRRPHLFPLCGTPRIVASSQSDEWLTSHQSETSVANLMMSVSLLYGDPSLVKNYEDFISDQFSGSKRKQKNRIKRAIEYLQNVISKFDDHIEMNFTAGNSSNIDEVLYQPLQQFIQSLSFYFDLQQKKTTLDQVTELNTHKKISDALSIRLRSTFLVSLELRIKKQLFFKGRKTSVESSEKVSSKNAFVLTSHQHQQVLEAFALMRDLKRMTESFLANPKRSFPDL